MYVVVQERGRKLKGVGGETRLLPKIHRPR